jgi:group I intron endonuclease
MYGIIYRVTGLTGKIYIGQTKKSLTKRKSEHICRMKKGDRRTAFCLALLEEGYTNFIWEQIDTAENAAELDAKEKHYIALYKSDDPAFGYNGNGGGSSAKLKPETKRKISEGNKGKKGTWHGKNLSEGHRRAISKGLEGHTTSPETRKKISATLKRLGIKPPRKKQEARAGPYPCKGKKGRRGAMPREPITT